MARERPRLSVIISTFERPEALRAALEGYRSSTYLDAEIIVADDGSGGVTKALVEGLERDFPMPLRHAWQPHVGFRLAAVRNLAVRASRGEILFFTDGDCIPAPDALQAHALQCAPGRSICGFRHLLTDAETASLLSGDADLCSLMGRARTRDALRLRWERIKCRWYSGTRLKQRPKLLTANASVHRADFERVNGFDERFVGWGYEDEDLARRMRRLGTRIVDATADSRVFHLFHPVDVSHRPNAKATPNYAYFKLGRCLTRPLRGLETRAVEDLVVEWLIGSPPPRGLRVSSEHEPPEVSLQLEGASRATKPRGAVVVLLGERELTLAAVLKRLEAELMPPRA